MSLRWAYFKLQYPIVDRMFSDARRCSEIQHQVLQQKIRQTLGSRFARDHGFTANLSVSDFRRQVPIADFEYFRPYVDDVRAGNAEALFGAGVKPLMFALTSGTTDRPKHVPVTNHFVASYKRGWKIWGLKAHADHMDLLKKDYLHLASDWQQSRTSGGIWCGNISGLAAETRPAVVRRPFVVPPQVAKVSDWIDRQYTILRLSLPSRRLGMIITANPLTLIKLAQLADLEKESLLRDLRNGTLTLPSGLGGDSVHPQLMKRIQPVDEHRCQELERMVEQTGHLLPRDAWPELSVVAVWMGGSVAAFIPEVRELYGDCSFRDHGLSASEGRMTIPVSDESNSGMLDFTSNYYEFIPVDEIDHEDPCVFEAHELKEGDSYYILLTNSGGLFRYNIHDVVKCVGFKGQTPLLEFLHKGAHCTNMTGEKLTEYQVATAVRDGFSDLKRNVETVLLVPVMGSPPQYVLLVEESVDEPDAVLAERVDARLAALNCEYQDRLQTRRLKPIVIRRVVPGTWQKLRDEKIASRGGSQEQYKHSFLADSDEVLNSIFDRS